MDNRSRLATPLGLMLGTLGLALLTACGGGGDEPATEVPLTRAAVTICGVQPTAIPGVESHTLSGAQSVELDGYSTQMSLVTSLAGYPYDGAPVPLSILLEDLRDVALGYIPYDTPDTMGIEMGSRFDAGSVACVRGLSRVKNEGTEGSPSYQFMWASETVPGVPVDAVPNHAINGFEFLNSSDTTAATAVFRMSKVLLANPSPVQVCHVTGNTPPACTTPTMTEEATQWVFKSPVTQPGVYVLSAGVRELPLD